MRDYWRWIPARVVVPGLFVVYLAGTLLMPTPFLVLLPGLAVIIAARAWALRGGLIVAGVAAPALLLGFWRLVGAPLFVDLAGHGPWITGWIARGYCLAWMMMMVLAALVGNLARQARQLNQANADLRQAQQRLTALHQIAISLSTTLEVSRLLEIILERIGQLWGYDHGSVLLWEEATQELVVAAARGYAEGTSQRFSRDHGICGHVFQTGQPLLVGDVTKDPRYVEGVKGAASELAVPLIWEGRTLGVLNVESRILNAYNQTDLDLLTTVAEQAAAAIGNARLHEETRDLAITDPHTGLFNYRHFQEALGVAVRDAQLIATPCSLLMLDLDFFKRVNDTYGHPTGDAVLQQFARLLRESCRAEDQVFRYGGEEFAIILPGAPDEVAVRVAGRIREKVAAHPFATRSGRRLDFPVTVSIGVATYPRDGLTQVDLLIAADTALYGAKAGGRNRVVSAGSGAHAEPA